MRPKTWLICILVFVLLAAGCRGKDGSRRDAGFSPDEVYALGSVTLTKDAAVYLLGSLSASCETSYGAALGTDEKERSDYEEWLRDVLLPEEFSSLAALHEIAVSEGLSLSNRDESAIRAVVTDDIVLTSGDESYYTVPKETVWGLLRTYRLASLAIGKLSENISITVSDDEVRVIAIRQLILADSGEAMQVFLAMQDGDSFETASGMFSGSRLKQLNLRRGGDDPILEEAAFSLGTGEYSMPVHAAEGWSVIFCDSEYDPALTRENRSALLRAAREDAWLSRVETVLADHVLYRSDELAQRIADAVPQAGEGLYELYRRIFPDSPDNAS